MLRMQRDRNANLWCTGCARHRKMIERRLPMSLSSHVEELKKKHQSLSEQVEEVQRSPGATDFEISELKKQKLRVKEEIARLSVDA